MILSLCSNPIKETPPFRPISFDFPTSRSMLPSLPAGRRRIVKVTGMATSQSFEHDSPLAEL